MLLTCDIALAFYHNVAFSERLVHIAHGEGTRRRDEMPLFVHLSWAHNGRQLVNFSLHERASMPSKLRAIRDNQRNWVPDEMHLIRRQKHFVRNNRTDLVFTRYVRRIENSLDAWKLL